MEYPIIEAPTQSLLQKWLREKHNIHIGVYYNKNSCVWDVECWHVDDVEPFYYGNIEFNTYEEALENGLQEALKLIKE